MSTDPVTLVPGRLEGAEAGVGLAVDTGLEHAVLKLPFAPEEVSAAVGRQVVLGIRPERITGDLRSAAPRGSTVQSLVVQVDLVEPTGADTLVLARVNGRRIICRVHPGLQPKASDHLPLLFDVSNAVLFDPESGVRIDATGNPAQRDLLRAG